MSKTYSVTVPTPYGRLVVGVGGGHKSERIKELQNQAKVEIKNKIKRDIRKYRLKLICVIFISGMILTRKFRRK